MERRKFSASPYPASGGGGTLRTFRRDVVLDLEYCTLVSGIHIIVATVLVFITVVPSFSFSSVVSAGVHGGGVMWCFFVLFLLFLLFCYF